MTTMEAFETQLDASVRFAAHSLGVNALAGLTQLKRLREPTRLALNEVRAGLDKRQRAFYASATGRCALSYAM